MELPAELKEKNTDELEAWFVDNLSTNPLPIDAMLAAIESLGAQKRTGMADSWADLLLDSLAEKRDRDAAKKMLFLQKIWHENDSSFKELCRKTLDKVCPSKIEQGFVTGAGFDTNISAYECLARFDALSSMKQGTICLDRTWGFGIVKRTDDFYQKITIDFDKKRDHQMSFTYAAETLELLSEDHLLAIKHKDPAKLEDLIKNNPGEIVKTTIKNYGPLNTVILKETICPVIISEENWKTFWDKARKQLKADPLIEVPTKRNDPIVLRETEKAYDENWFAKLKEERDIDRILELLPELYKLKDPLEKDFIDIISNRLAFIIKGAGHRRPEFVARAILAAHQLSPDCCSAIDADKLAEEFFDSDKLATASPKMTAKSLKDFIKYLSHKDARKTTDLFLRLLVKMKQTMLNEAMAFLLNGNTKAELVEKLIPLFASRKGSIQLVSWAARNTDVILEDIVKRYDFLMYVMECFEMECSGDELKAQNQLKDSFEKREWLKIFLDAMSLPQKQEFMGRINQSRGVDVSEKRHIMARIIKLYPELQKALTTAPATEEEPVSTLARMTSRRSYRQRQSQLKNLVEKEIPQNSRDIGVARSYGDLRENAEYDAAKQQQSILMRRQKEFEEDLKTVQESDFKDLPADKAGLGTCIEIERPDNSVEKYYLLGEWDADEKMGIIPSKSKLATLLVGLKEGDEAQLPSTDGPELCKILSVSELPKEIKEWVLGDD